MRLDLHSHNDVNQVGWWRMILDRACVYKRFEISFTRHLRWGKLTRLDHPSEPP